MSPIRWTKLLVLVLVLGLSAVSCGDGSLTAADSPGGGTELAQPEQVTAPIATSTPSPTATPAPEQEPERACTPLDPSASTIAIDPPWEIGTTRQLLLTVTKAQSGLEGSSETPVQVRVISERGGVPEFAWRNGTVGFSGLDGGPVLERLLEDLPPVDVQYRIGDDSAIAPSNADELRTYLVELLDRLGLRAGDPEAYDALVGLYSSLPDADLMSLAVGEVALYHSLEGFEIALDEVIESDGVFPNVLGGEPFPAHTTIEVLDRADGDGCVLIQWATTPDPDIFLDIMMESVAEAFGVEPDEEGLTDEELVGEFEMSTVVTAQYDPGSGFLQSISTTTKIVLGPEQRSETKTLVDVTPR